MLSPPAIAPDAAATEAGIFGTVTDVPTIPRLTTPTIATSFRDEFRPDERYILERTTAQHMRNTSHRVDVIIVPTGFVIDALPAPYQTRCLLDPGMQFGKAGLLSAFDANRDLIYAAAARVYARGRKGSYDLVSTDF